MEVKPYKIVLLFLFTALLAACGGGSGPGCLSSTFIPECVDELPPSLGSPITFPAGGGAKGFNNTVTSIAPALDSSDDVYVGGNFTIYKKFRDKSHYPNK